MLAIIGTAIFYQHVFYLITAVLSMYIWIYSINMSVSCAVGAWRMRRDVEIDWHAKLEELLSQEQLESSEQSSEIMHLVFLPNYKEDEDMLFHTLENLGRSTIANTSVHVVLGMEEREGPAVHLKAERLINKSAHLFADISATFHPANLPGDIAGKSSNNQWAYRQTMQRYAQKISKMDTSRVFITCFDADTLVHPQYLAGLTYEALCLPSQERSWTMWQPPVLLLRNLFSCPAPTRVSGYGTIFFELGGLTNQNVSPHFTFSTYSFTLALSSHYMVDGWDRDVISEDHHMFCKCYFASIWEQMHALEDGFSSGEETIVSDVNLKPVYLPALSYLVESDDGWFASIYARFVQARRHSQGLAELSYVFLQHAHLLMSKQAGHLAWSTHRRIMGVAGKMASVHIVINVHSLGTLLATLMLVPTFLGWLAQNFDLVIKTCAEHGLLGLLNLFDLGSLKWLIFAIFGPIPLMGVGMSMVTYYVILDTLHGRFTRDVPRKHATDAQRSDQTNALAAPDVQGSAKGNDGLSLWPRLQLFLMIQNDYFSGAFLTMLAYGLVPVTLAAFSLLGKGDRGFQYIVGEKPTER